MQEDLESIEAEGIRVVAISYDGVDVLSRFATSANVSYPLLSDAGSETIKAFGVLNEQSRVPIAIPGTFLIGQDGLIKARLFEEGYVQRHSNEALIEAARAIQ